MKNFNNIATEIQNSMKNSQNILLHCHPNPDPDSIGSVLAMKRYLVSIGKKTTAIIGDSDYPFNMVDNLPIEKEIERKSFFDINLDDFDLFIILDSSSTSQISKKEDVIFPKHLKTVVIDHHKTNIGFGDINLIDKHSVSTTQVLYKLLKQWEVEIDKDLALYLFIGIYSDSGGFQFPMTSLETFRIATELVSICPNYQKTIFDLENNKNEIEIEMMGLALSNIKKYFNDKVVLSVIPYQIIKERKLKKDDAMKGLIANTLRSVIGWDIVGSLVEAEKGITTVSLRIRDEKKYDVSIIAKNVGIGGGGHAGAAGTTIMKDVYSAEKELVAYIDKTYKLKTKFDMQKKITDISKHEHNPKEHYSTLVTEVEEYIEIYSKPIKRKDLVRVIPDEELTNEEIGSALDIGKTITKLCQEYKKGNIGIDEIARETGNLLYFRNKPNILYKILNREIYDFLEKASEYDFYIERLKDL